MNATESNTIQQVSLNHITPKQLNDLERSVQNLLATLRKARLNDDALLELVESLRLLEQKLGETRRERFDEANPEYRGY